METHSISSCWLLAASAAHFILVQFESVSNINRKKEKKKGREEKREKKKKEKK